MSNRNSVLTVLCLLATACGGGSADEGTTSRGAVATTTGTERVVIDEETGEPIVASFAASEEEAAIPYRAPQDDESLGGLSRTGSAIVHDEDDATWRTPLPPTADPLDEPERSMRLSSREICPAELEGLEASFAEIPRGGALVLTADESAIDDLRARLSRFADMQRQARIADHQDHRSPVRFRDDDSEMLEATAVRVIDVEGGARLELEADDADDVEALRSELRDGAEALSQGRCPLSLQVRA